MAGPTGHPIDSAAPDRQAPAGPATRIRPLKRGDLADVVRIDAFHTGEEKRGYWTRMLRDYLRPRAGRAHVGLAAELEGQVVGFVLGDVRAFEFGSEPCGWILEIGVDPELARQGIASALLDEACRRLRAAGVSTIRTMVTRNDVPVLTFFRTNGFAAGPYVQLELLDDEAPAGPDER
jgi:ribosomal protein S18 acetylase RimI-like enzyme